MAMPAHLIRHGQGIKQEITGLIDGAHMPLMQVAIGDDKLQVMNTHPQR